MKAEDKQKITNIAEDNAIILQAISAILWFMQSTLDTSHFTEEEREYLDEFVDTLDDYAKGRAIQAFPALIGSFEDVQ